MHIHKLKNSILLTATLAMAMLTGGCRMVTDDIEECPSWLRIRFVCRDLKGGNYFANEVTSVNVWAFDADGGLVWSGSASGEELRQDDFYLDVPLPDGKYDFVSWCGLKDNTDFDLATYTPATREELEVKMKTLSEDGREVSDKRLTPVYNGVTLDVNYKSDPNKPTEVMAVSSLTKDTKDIRVMLQHINGDVLKASDFSVTITDANSEYAWNNTLLPGPRVTYTPWEVKYGETSSSDESKTKAEDDDETVTKLSTLLYSLSTGRLMENANAVLTIHRNTDDKDIVRIPLVQYLLLVKGHYGDLSDQEYLDRQDDYSIMFFIDPNYSWYVGGGIFINGWEVVPPQNNDF